MATVAEYQSGQAARSVREAWEAFQRMAGDVAADSMGSRIIANVERLAPLRVSLEEAAALIAQAATCAAGERVCKCMFPEAPSTESVFLDHLALGMVEVGKARIVDAQEACATLARHPGKAIVISKVEGRYQEICRTEPECCVYWNLEKRGVRCLGRLQPRRR